MTADSSAFCGFGATSAREHAPTMHAPPAMKVVQMVVALFEPKWTMRFLAIWSLSFLIAVGLTAILNRFSWGRAILGDSVNRSLVR